MEAKDYLSQTDVMTLLNQVPLFAGLGFHEQNLIHNHCHNVVYPEKEIVIEQGEHGDCLYIIIEGHVLISRKKTSKKWERINTLGPGEVFGEIAVLRDIPRTARVTTLTPCTFLTINAHDFLSIYPFFPPSARDNIQLIVAKRMKQIPHVSRSF